MEPPRHGSIWAPGIPRVSRLPVPQGSAKPVNQNSSPMPSLPRRNHITTPALPGEGQTGYDPARVVQPKKQILREQDRSPEFPKQFQDDKDQKDPYQPVGEGEISSSRLRKPRPSLSDRTMETLSQIPPSPSPSRRKSSFFNSESPITSPVRPGSSMSYSRPGTNQGSYSILPQRHLGSRPKSPEKRAAPVPAKPRTPLKTPAQRAVSSYVPRSLPPTHSRLNSVSNNTPSKSGSHRVSQEVPQEKGGVANAPHVPGLKGSRTIAARPSRARQPIGNAFRDPEDALATSAATLKGEAQPMRKKLPGTKVSVKKTVDVTNPEAEIPEGRTPPKSSAALRETIARAKAARRGVSNTQEASSAAQDQLFDIDIGGNNHAVICKRIATARKEGRLNIAALGLREVPREILNMYDTSTLEVNEGSWAESVDVIKFMAADNEISALDDQFFPPTVENGAEEQRPSVFGGLETMDLHGNMLSNLPAPLANLVFLTTLNLSRNRLDNGSLNVIGRIGCLRDLRFAENSLRGDLNDAICHLRSLEHLDLSKNTISQLPTDICELRALHTLNVSGNKLQSLPIEDFSSMPLRSLDVSRNDLKGVLFSTEVGGLSELKVLDVSFNALTSVTAQSSLHLAALHTLNLSENRLQALPDISGLPLLVTLTVEGNRISAIPEGLISLTSLRNVEFSRNDIRQIDDRIGLMDNLSVFRIANNPLRERRLLNLNTEDLLRELRTRHRKANGLEPAKEAEDDSNLLIPAAKKGSSSSWSVQLGGVLDRSSTGLHSIECEQLEHFIDGDPVKSLILHHNAFSIIPHAVESIGQTLLTLDLSHNKLAGEAYLRDSLELPKLKTLNVSANTLSSLLPLISALSAPALSELDISRNRLTSLLILREAFSGLTSLKVADNQITDLPVDVVRGLQVLDVSGNAINSLDPMIGLLGREGLRTFLVGANTFRVPRRDVVEKGTEAILTWLRGRIADE